jgi:urease accessory protein
MSSTTLTVELVAGRHRVRMRSGVLRAQRLHGPPDRARVALVGQTALLLGGDAVHLDVTIGPGATLELTEVAGTVAYHGRGRSARWTASIRLDAGAQLRWPGEPLVIADGADVNRSIAIDLAEGATAVVRETIVLGRSGERGGRLRSTTTVNRVGRPVLIEDLVLDPAGRCGPGLLGDQRVLDSLLCLGPVAPSRPMDAGAVRFALTDPESTLTRFLGRELADSPLGPAVAGRPPARLACFQSDPVSSTGRDGPTHREVERGIVRDSRPE